MSNTQENVKILTDVVKETAKTRKVYQLLKFTLTYQVDLFIFPECFVQGYAVGK